MPARVLKHSVFPREVMPPAVLNLEIDPLTRTEAIGAADCLAAVVGNAHARRVHLAVRRDFRRRLTGGIAHHLMRRAGGSPRGPAGRRTRAPDRAGIF